MASSDGTTAAMFVSSTDITLHGKLFNCRIKGNQAQSGSSLYSEVFDVQFDVCVDPEQSCPFDEWDGPPVGWEPPAAMVVYVGSGETITTSFSYANWKNKFASICTDDPNVCGAIDWSFSVVTALERTSFD